MEEDEEEEEEEEEEEDVVVHLFSSLDSSMRGCEKRKCIRGKQGAEQKPSKVAN